MKTENPLPPLASLSAHNPANTEVSSYLNLIKLERPFFELILGKLYDCQMEDLTGIKNASIIPLAFENGKNRQYVMTDARRLLEENAGFVHDIIKMDFDHMWNDGIHRNYPFDYSALTLPCATRQDGTLIDFSELRYFGFVLTEEI